MRSAKQQMHRDNMREDMWGKMAPRVEETLSHDIKNLCWQHHLFSNILALRIRDLLANLFGSE